MSIGNGAFYECKSLNKDIRDEIAKRFGPDVFRSIM